MRYNRITDRKDIEIQTDRRWGRDIENPVLRNKIKIFLRSSIQSLETCDSPSILSYK